MKNLAEEKPKRRGRVFSYEDRTKPEDRVLGKEERKMFVNITYRWL